MILVLGQGIHKISLEHLTVPKVRKYSKTKTKNYTVIGVCPRDRGTN